MLTPTPGRPLLRLRHRVIPTLLIDSAGKLVKTIRFGKRDYIGDPINTVKIFNTKQVDELMLLDIDATAQGREPDYERIAGIVEEAFMPVAYGGGIHSVPQIDSIYRTGVEKVLLSSVLSSGFELVRAAADRWGSQAITVCLPTARDWLGRTRVRTHSGRKTLPGTPVDIAQRAVEAGAGEILVYSIDRDGTWSGFDLPNIGAIAQSVGVPVIACGGASGVSDFAQAIRTAHASAVAAGSRFVYQARGKGVLISYPRPDQLDAELATLSDLALS